MFYTLIKHGFLTNQSFLGPICILNYNTYCHCNITIIIIVMRKLIL